MAFRGLFRVVWGFFCLFFKQQQTLLPRVTRLQLQFIPEPREPVLPITTVGPPTGKAARKHKLLLLAWQGCCNNTGMQQHAPKLSTAAESSPFQVPDIKEEAWKKRALKHRSMDEHRLTPDRMGCTKEALWEKGLISRGFCRKTG